MNAMAALAPRVIAADPRSDALWRSLATGVQGSLFTSPPWIRAICDTYGFVPRARIATDASGRPSDGFAWVPVSDLRGDRVISLPFSDRAEPFVTDAATCASLVEEASNTGMPLTLRCLDTVAAMMDSRLARTHEAAWHGTHLGVPPEEMHRSLSSGTRRNLAAAHRNGVRVCASTEMSAVRIFHGLHVSLRKNKYRLLAQPWAFFERIWDEFAAIDGIVTLLAYVGDEPVAGALFLAWGDTLYYKFGASLAGALPLRPNEALFWSAISWASEREYRLLDWGLSDLDQPGLVAFKRKWLSEERRIITLCSPSVPSGDPGPGQMLGELTRLFTADDVPHHITEQAGSLLYRYFA